MVRNGLKIYCFDIRLGTPIRNQISRALCIYAASPSPREAPKVNLIGQAQTYQGFGFCFLRATFARSVFIVIYNIK